MEEKIWESMLTAELNAKYWLKLGHKYYYIDRSAKIFLAFISSTTVITWLNDWMYLMKICSILTAAISVTIPLINWPKTIVAISGLRQEWLELSYDYKRLWNEFEEDRNNDYLAEYNKLQEKETKVNLLETVELPSSKKLQFISYEEVLEERGLTGKE